MECIKSWKEPEIFSMTWWRDKDQRRHSPTTNVAQHRGVSLTFLTPKHFFMKRILRICWSKDFLLYNSAEKDPLAEMLKKADDLFDQGEFLEIYDLLLPVTIWFKFCFVITKIQVPFDSHIPLAADKRFSHANTEVGLVSKEILNLAHACLWHCGWKLSIFKNTWLHWQVSQ